MEPDEDRRSWRLEDEWHQRWDARSRSPEGHGDLDQQYTTTLAARSFRQKGLLRCTATMAPGGRSRVVGIGRVGMGHGLESPDFKRRTSHGVVAKSDDIVRNQIVIVWA